MSRTSLTYEQDTQTLIGQRKRELQDVETGEIILVDQITKRVYGTRQFWKVYLMDFLTVLGIIDSKQLDIFLYIVEHTDPTRNMFIGTYKEIAEECCVSSATIAKIMKKLQASNFIRMKHRSVWYVNPNILMKGNDTKRQILLSYYENTEPVDQLIVERTARDEIPTTSEAEVPTLEAGAD